MKKIALFAGVLALCGASFVVGRAVAQDEQGGMQLPPWMSMTKEHAALAKFAGEWDAAGEYTAPGQEPQSMPGTCSTEVILNGRYTETRYHGEAMGMPFEGRLLLGYDTIEKKYVSVWFDSWLTVPLVYHGVEKDGEIHYEGQGVNTATGQKQTVQMRLRWEGDDRYVARFYSPDMEGKMFNNMTITYTRKDAGSGESMDDDGEK